MHLALLALAAFLQDTTPARVKESVTIPRVEATAVVDGRLDDSVWQQAAVLSDFHQWMPVDGRPAEERTVVRVWYAPDAIWFGITAYDRQPGTVRATVADRDNLGNDDHVTIYLDTFGDRRRAYVFTVNPIGQQQDGVRSEGGNQAASLTGGTDDLSPDFLWDSKGMRTDSGYVVEVRIPFKSLRYPTSARQAWGLNVVRDTKRTGYTDTWTDVRRASASFLAQGGVMTGLHDMKRGVVMEMQPVFTASANGRVNESGQFERGKVDGSAGANLRLGFTAMTLDATWNPDFSQVEADQGVVTANERFAIFFEERRPFFLEGIELFSTPNRLVYTREIVDPIAGAKFTGKFGRYGVAYLSAVDESGDQNALFNIARVRRDIGTNSLAGITYTDRISGDDYNRVLSGDTRIVFGGMYFAQGQLGQSWTRDDAGSRTGQVWQAQLDRTGRAWGFNYQVNGLSDDFETQSGFVNRVGIVTGHIMNRFSIYGKPGALLETATVFFGPERTWSYDSFLGDGAIEGNDDANLSFRFRGGWEVDPKISRDFVHFLPADYAGYELGGASTEPFTPRPELNNAFGTSLKVSTPTWQWGDAEAQVQHDETAIFPEAAAGRELRLSGELSLRPQRSVRSSFELTYSRITRERDGSEFARTIIPHVKIEYQPTRALFFRFIGEYQSQRRAALVDEATGRPLLIGGADQPATLFNTFRMDWLASYEPSPGTVFFLGYGSTMADEGTLTFRNLRRQTDGLFMKVAYRLRR
ncbi:MAG TPA: DUF5916 domain-containing protein [Gemmatimonadales bacterium]|jgi:hypothetical protein|nr:DUF5916 domain-containing protein [Gemmatimonadales bacterium]